MKSGKEPVMVGVRTIWVAAVLLALGLAATVLGQNVVVPYMGVPGAAQRQRVGDYEVSGPFVSGNLAIFLVHGEDRVQGKTYLTLGEAMEKKVVIVHETGDVNELAIENVGDQDVYVQSGDIVKGGQQDRTIAQDFVLPRKSGKTAIAAFCVEHGRWTQRGSEAATQFGSSEYAVAGKNVKLAAREANSQMAVWKEVHENQQKLSANVAADVTATASPSSYQLTLENGKVRDATEKMVKDSSGLIDGKDDVIGYAVAINGKINSMDVYGSREMFRKMWPKMIQASATEAVAEMKKDARFAPASAKDLADCVKDAENGKADDKQITPRVTVVQRETDKNVVFETVDKEGKGDWVHRSYLSR